MKPYDLKGFAEKNRYRLRYETESSETGNRTLDPWLAIIPGKHGHIYVHGETKLGCATKLRGGKSRQIRTLTGVRVTQDGDDGINAVFGASLLPEVCRIVGARKKRTVSPEVAAAGAERLRAYRESQSGG